jgi:xanthine dehydrogenase YagT iron-sulfur-binding subunit
MPDNRDDGQRTRVFTRRAFIKGAGAAAAITSFIGGPTPPSAGVTRAQSSPTPASGAAERLGPDAATIVLTVNGKSRKIAVEPRVTLAEALRDHLGLHGTKLVCDRGACGACTVHLDGNPVVACMMLAADARGHEIVTIEGLGAPDRMHPVQSAFVEADALQCGFCTPGMVMSVAALLSRNPAPDMGEVKRAVAGNICRCGTYPHVFKAALAAAAKMRGVKPPGERA